jgi:hypothetical protein
MADFSSAIWNKPAAADPPADDVVTKSCRFNSDGHLTRTFSASTDDQKKRTISVWVKRSELNDSNGQKILGYQASNAGGTYQFSGAGGGGSSVNDDFVINDRNATADSADYIIRTAGLFRDVAAWYHIFIKYDTTDSTPADRIQIWMNGKRVTALNTGDTGYPALNHTTTKIFTASTGLQYIGGDPWGGHGFDGYMADFHFIDGTAYDATDFAEEDTITGQWKPKATSGLTYGDNGFRLEFLQTGTGTPTSSTIGADTSGNDNHWTTTNLAASDVVNDTPTNSYATLNPLDKYSGVTLAEGNLKLTSGDYHYARSTFALPSSGKWYWEYYWKDHGYLGGYGISAADYDLNNGPTGKCRMTMGGSWYTSFNSGGLTEFCADQARYGGTNWGTTYEDGDIVMVAVDRDNSKIWFGKNGSWISTSGTPNPATGVDPRNSSVTSTTDWFPTVGTSSTYDGEVYANYGQDPFFAGEKASGQDTSQSEFYYAPPSGYLSLCTANLPTPTIAKPAEHFDVLTYASSGAKTFDNGTTSMQPDLVWVKARGNAYDHELTDSVRGVTKALSSNATNVESTDSTGLTVFGSDGFTVGAGTNYSTSSMVAWCWRKHITSGFDIVEYTGDTTGGTQEISLTSGFGTPEMVIVKAYYEDDLYAGNTTSNDWYVWHHKLTDEGYYILLNGTAGQAESDTSMGGDDLINVGSGTVTVGGDAMSGPYLNEHDDMSTLYRKYIIYAMKSVAGFSKVGSYTGNASADGTFVYCGFRPAYIMVKKVAGGTSWYIHDTARSPYNYSDLEVIADGSNAEWSVSGESAGERVDILSNGFKNRSTNDAWNGSGAEYLFYAVAEFPLKTANAR